MKRGGRGRCPATHRRGRRRVAVGSALQLLEVQARGHGAQACACGAAGVRVRAAQQEAEPRACMPTRRTVRQPPHAPARAAPRRRSRSGCASPAKAEASGEARRAARGAQRSAPPGATRSGAVLRPMAAIARVERARLDGAFRFFSMLRWQWLDRGRCASRPLYGRLCPCAAPAVQRATASALLPPCTA